MAVVATVVALTVAMSPAAGAEGVNLGFDFDRGPDGYAGTRAWSTGCFSTAGARGCVQATRDAALRPIPRADGTALRFPREGSVVIRVAHDEALSPGRADFMISALVRMTPEQVKAGANVVQKGMYDSSRGQWKLQVDSGVPSCRVSGRNAEARFATAEARAKEKLANGEWTSIHCIRKGSRLRLFVDGVAAAASDDADVNIDNGDPVLIGGKHAGAGNDQFRGDLDDVSVTIE